LRANLDRVEALLKPVPSFDEPELDPKSPLNKTGVNLTARGIEVCYRMYDAGKTRYAVSEALGMSYGAATHRFHAWEKLGGKDRERQPLE
jgi:hypothetical protein